MDCHREESSHPISNHQTIQRLISCGSEDRREKIGGAVARGCFDSYRQYFCIYLVDHVITLDKKGDVYAMGDDTYGQCGQN